MPIIVRIRKGDKWKTAFNTPTGHYEYLLVPFGLINVPSVCQGLVYNVLRDVFLDDILAFSPTMESHQLQRAYEASSLF